MLETRVTDGRATSGIPWWEPQIAGGEYELIRQVLDSNFLNDGDVTTRFEHAVADRVGARFAVAVTSGTSALFLALVGAGVGPGDEVIVPDVTFIATANAVVMAGARPVLVDVEPETLNIDPEAVRRAVTARTRAIMPVHVSGRAAAIADLHEIATQQGLALIEDAAEAFMSRHEGMCLGTFGRAGCLSFSPNKTITTGQGGMVLTNDEHLHGRLRELKDQGRPVRGTGGDDVHQRIGYNFKLTNLQAAVGIAQLERLDVRLARMRRIRDLYAEELGSAKGLRLLPFDLAGGECPQWTDVLCPRRDGLDQFLAEQRVQCRRFWYPLHTQAPYRADDAQFPVSSHLVPQALWLPSSFTLDDEDVRTTSRLILSFLEEA